MTLSARQARWAELCTCNFVIEHIKGKQNTVADALSRNLNYEGETPPMTARVIMRRRWKSFNEQKHTIENCASGMEQPRFPEETPGRN